MSEPVADYEVPWRHRRVRDGHFGRVGAAMLERGLVTEEQLSAALELQRSSGGRVGEILVESGALSSFELAQVLADHLGLQFTDLRAKLPDAVLATFLPEEVARRYDALAIARWNDHLVIAMANPSDIFALDDLQMVTGQPVIATMAVKEDLRAAIDRVYRGSIVETTLDAATSDYKATDSVAARQALEVDEGPIVRLVDALMGQAITDQASDLHVQPCSTHITVRFRIDGVLHDYSQVPLELLRPLVSRVKILAGLDIAQNRTAQDGRFSLTIQERSVDVRVVTIPTAAGESVILRLLDPVRDALSLSSLALSETEYARFVPAFQGSQGAVFIVGPTGSGKTSTVYAALSEINTPSKSIISVEDPVEFRLDGVKQIQINPRVGLTFPTTLPSVLRSDPDVVFIGEVRDTETARIAADASITGHLVLSTLHATRAAAAPMRLIEMGVEPYLVASALTLVASQRLARKLCEHCSEPADDRTLDHLRELGVVDATLDGATTRRPVGCPACRNTGYRGRLPIFEIMPVSERVSRLILERASRLEIERLAVEEGMETLRQAALRRVVHGDLSVEEMLRVTS
jgi:type IV pilus assembly protein PilB